MLIVLIIGGGRECGWGRGLLPPDDSQEQEQGWYGTPLMSELDQFSPDYQCLSAVYLCVVLSCCSSVDVFCLTNTENKANYCSIRGIYLIFSIGRGKLWEARKGGGRVKCFFFFSSPVASNSLLHRSAQNLSPVSQLVGVTYEIRPPEEQGNTEESGSGNQLEDSRRVNGRTQPPRLPRATISCVALSAPILFSETPYPLRTTSLIP